MLDGFYWVRRKNGDYNAVEVFNGYIFQAGVETWKNARDFDFGPNPKPLPKPDFDSKEEPSKCTTKQ